MNHLSRAASLILSGLMLGLPAAAAQENPRPPSKADSKPRRARGGATPTARQQAALFMLEQIFEDAKSFDDDLLKIKTQANIADILWPYDEPRARRQFAESFRALDSADSDGGAADVAAPGGTPLIREFLDFASDTFLQLSGVAAQLGTPGATPHTAATNPVDMMTGQRLLPSFARYMPDKAALFRQALDAMARRTTRGQENAGLDKLFQPAGTDELLEQARSERNVHLKDLLYVRAAMAAAAGGDFEQALSIIGKLEDAERRTSFDSILRFQAASASLRKDDVDAALRYAKGVGDLRQRALLYGTVARSLLDKGDAGRAAEILDDAELTVAKADDSATKANALTVLAEVKSRLNPAQGFELLETAVKAFNRADADEARKGRAAAADGNPVTTMMLNAVFKLDAPDFEPVFSRLAKVDFDRAAQLARTLERKDRSVSAQIAVCRSVLAAKPTKTVATTPGSEKRR